MAEKALKKLEDQLNCLICLSTYTDPKLLQCNHVFCKDCLVGLAHRNPLGLPCPTCRRVTPIPLSGVGGLQSAFQTNHLLEILYEHERVKQDVAYCPRHQNRELELYCETCEELICVQCTIQQHNGHKYDFIGEVFERHKQEIMSSLNPAEQQLTLARKALEMLGAREREITDQKAVLQMQIHMSLKQLHEIIYSREKELSDELDSITQGKLSEVALQKEQVETTLAQLESCLDMVKENLTTSSQGVVLKMKTTLLERVKNLTSSFQPDIMELNTEANTTFSSSHAAAEACHAHGLVSAPTVPDPSQCHALPGVPDVITVGEKSTTLIQVNTHEGKPLENVLVDLECELVSELTGISARGSVERKGQSQYEVGYQPTVKGRHQLHIKVMGEHIRASPYLVSSVKKLGTLTLSIDRLKSPCGVAVSQSGDVVVTERDGCCVSVFSPKGDKLRSFGTHGSGQSQFQHPSGVAIDNEGNILVADCKNHCIQKFTAEGQFLAAQQSNCVKDIAINASNDMFYVVNDMSHHVQILNFDLTFSCTFGKRGKNEGDFICPNGIACDNTGNVYVADSGNNRIQVFTSTGEFLRKFGSYGEGKGKLRWPISIALDSEDKVYVSDNSNHRVSIFTSTGQFVTSFGSKGKGPGQFQDPCGLVVDSNGVVYVCDTKNSRLQVF